MQEKMTIFFLQDTFVSSWYISKKIPLTQFLGKLGFFLGIHHHKAYIFMFQDLGHKLKGETSRGASESRSERL